MQDTVSLIKDRLSILDVVGATVKLKKAGKSYIGLCPFHKEKTPSFHVSVERGSYHCFGCSEGGDIFTFVEKSEGLDFKGALKVLAEKAGVQIVDSRGNGEDKDRLDKLRDAMRQASDYYQAALTPTSEAYAYALSRGLSKETIKEWQLGVAPDDWRKLFEHLSSKGFTVPELAAAGLIKEADGKPGTYYDRFRARLIFPIRDIAGRVVAFTGRALKTEEPAKYLNSPETDVYHKSEILFGMDRAKDAIRTRGFAILVEGQMDLLHAHQAGFTNTIALSGTALTERHVSLMKRYSENLMFALDADTAGLAATWKSALLALGQGLKVKAVALPRGKDPADLIKEDAKEFTKRVAEAKPVPEFFLATLTEREKDPHRLVLSVERIVLPLIAATPSPIERDHFVSHVARVLGLSPEAVAASVKKSSNAPSPEGVVARGAAPLPTVDRAKMLQATVQCYPGTPLAQRIKTEYARIVGTPLPEDMLPEGELFASGVAFGEAPEEGAADDLLNAFEEAVIREAYQEAVGQLRRAEISGDSKALKQAEARCTDLAKKLAALS